MQFNIEAAPPGQETVEMERAILHAEIRRLQNRDMLITISLVLVSSLVMGLVVYWQTSNLTYTGIATAVFPLLGSVFSALGLTNSVGFRSAANRILELQQELATLNPVAMSSIRDVDTLVARHKRVKVYHDRLMEQDRPVLNAELAMYWEFDASTLANTARGRDLVKKAEQRIVNAA